MADIRNGVNEEALLALLKSPEREQAKADIKTIKAVVNAATSSILGSQLELDKGQLELGDLSMLFSLEEAQPQLPHTDGDPVLVHSCLPRQVPLAFLIAVEKGTSILVWPSSHNLFGASLMAQADALQQQQEQQETRVKATSRPQKRKAESSDSNPSKRRQQQPPQTSNPPPPPPSSTTTLPLLKQRQRPKNGNKPLTFSQLQPIDAVRLFLKPGQFLVFRQDLVHAGDSRIGLVCNLRFHIYIDNIHIPRSPDTTYPFTYFNITKMFINPDLSHLQPRVHSSQTEKNTKVVANKPWLRSMKQ